MFRKPMFFVVGFLLASFSLCVESIKFGGSNIIQVDHSLAKFATQNGLNDESGCFSEFSRNQANTVRELGEEWQVCGDNESKANTNMNKNLRKKTDTISKIPNDICVKIDDECRNQYAIDGNIEAALDCYIELLIPARNQILEMAENCKLARLNVENESRSIISIKKNCTNEANFDYLRKSDGLFEKVVTTCEFFSSEESTSVATTRKPIQSTSPIIPTEPKVSSTTEVVPPSTTQSLETEPPTPTRRVRFPWN